MEEWAGSAVDAPPLLSQRSIRGHAVRAPRQSAKPRRQAAICCPSGSPRGGIGSAIAAAMVFVAAFAVAAAEAQAGRLCTFAHTAAADVAIEAEP
mmetsp:Transcript_14345/g.44319  ORF Transcript_14345/g.44319 Transcript_14345/m.44319 type:complete len:95 (+) Transcript_14345:778-1062(+)